MPDPIEPDYRSMATRYRKAARRFRKQRDELAEGYETLEADHTKLKESSTNAPLAKKLADAEGKLRTIAHKDAFKAKAKGIRPEALDDAYGLSGYKAESDTIDEAAIEAAVEGLRTSRSYLFAEDKPAQDGEGKTPEKKPPGPGASRGGTAGTAAGVTYTKKHLQDAEFAAKHSADIAAAHKEGRVNWDG